MGQIFNQNCGMRNAHKIMIEKLEDEGVDWKMILKCTLRNKVGGVGVDIFSLGQVIVAETSEDPVRPSGIINAGKFRDNLWNCSLLNIDPAVWT
jgi:hypothetical protein